MDPDKTFTHMVTALAHGDTDEARKHFEVLVEWLERGGFPPSAFKALVQPRTVDDIFERPDLHDPYNLLVS